MELAQSLLRRAWDKQSALDETVLQLCKHVNGNPRLYGVLARSSRFVQTTFRKSVAGGLELLFLCFVYLSPSPMLARIVRYHLLRLTAVTPVRGQQSKPDGVSVASAATSTAAAADGGDAAFCVRIRTLACACFRTLAASAELHAKKRELVPGTSELAALLGVQAQLAQQPAALVRLVGIRVNLVDGTELKLSVDSTAKVKDVQDQLVSHPFALRC